MERESGEGSGGGPRGNGGRDVGENLRGCGGKGGRVAGHIGRDVGGGGRAAPQPPRLLVAGGSPRQGSSDRPVAQALPISGQWQKSLA